MRAASGERSSRPVAAYGYNSIHKQIMRASPLLLLLLLLLLRVYNSIARAASRSTRQSTVDTRSMSSIHALINSANNSALISD